MAEPKRSKHWTLAACTVAVAAAVGAPAIASASPEAVQQIQRYCTRSWQNAGIAPQDWQDCTQQALAELLERVTQRGLTVAIDNVESQERRELNRTVWRTIQRWRRSPKWVRLEEEAARDGSSRPGQADAWGEVLAAARACLSERQQRILALSRDGWKVSEIADQLQLPSARVSDEKYKAIGKLRDWLGVA